MNAEQFQRQTNVSRETLEMYEIWLTLLSHWNKRINLVSASTLHDFWLRHALDSWQVAELLPGNTKTILDMGAGAGFPGLAMAIALKGTLDVQVTLVESNGKKCNSLSTVIRELGLPAKAVQARVENLELPKEEQHFDVITARAFAPLPKLLKHSLPFWYKRRRGSDSDRPGNKMQNTVAILPKGEKWQSEVDAARKRYDFDLTTTKSQTSDLAMILQVNGLRRKGSDKALVK